MQSKTLSQRAFSDPQHPMRFLLFIAFLSHYSSWNLFSFRLSRQLRHTTHDTLQLHGHRPAGRHVSLTALSLADHAQVHLFFAGPHVQLALAVVGGAVAAAHRLVGLHTLGWTHTLTTLGITDRPKRAVAASFV